MLLTTRVKLVLAEAPDTGIPGVKVSLYDRDIHDEDDWLGTDTTDDQGEILFIFESEQYTDAEDQPEWRIDSLPDLFVIVYDAQDQVVFSTRSEALQNNLPRRYVVEVSRELAEKHGLMPKN